MLKIIAHGSNGRSAVLGWVFVVSACLMTSGCSVSYDLSTPSSVDHESTPMNSAETVFRPDGGYEFDGGSDPHFKEVVWLSIITGTSVGYGGGCAPKPCTPPPTPRIENRANWKPQTKRGLLITNDHNYVWRDEELSIDRFAFETEIYNGQSYRFTGQFLTDGNFEETNPNGIVLTGRLTKLADRQIVEEQDVNFVWFSWDEVDQETFRRVRRSSFGIETLPLTKNRDP